MQVFVLTREINQYDQDGEYFVDVYADYPTREQLIKAGVTEEAADYLLKGGNGRMGTEDEWWNIEGVGVK